MQGLRPFCTQKQVANQKTEPRIERRKRAPALSGALLFALPSRRSYLQPATN